MTNSIWDKKPKLMNGKAAPVYTLKQVSELSGINIKTIYEYAQNGQFPTLYTMGKRQQFIKHQDLVNFLNYDPENTNNIDEKINENDSLQSA